MLSYILSHIRDQIIEKANVDID